VSTSNIASLSCLAGKSRDEHTVQLYTDDRHLIDVLAQYVRSALENEHCALIVATDSHRSALRNRLASDGLDLENLIAQRRCVMLDAAETLDRFMVEGHVEKHGFYLTVGGIFRQIRGFSCNTDSRIFVFGEMVALLWAAGKCEEAIRLENFWNELALSYRFTLLCAYPIMGFYSETELELFVRACAQHSRVSTSEKYRTPHDKGESRPEEKFQFGSSRPNHDSWLTEAELRFRVMMEAVQGLSVFMFDPEGTIKSWNSGAEFMQGYSAEEIIGRNVMCLYSEEDVPRERFKSKLDAAINAGSFEEDRWKMRKDGSRFWASIIIIPARNSAGDVVGFAEITRSSRKAHFIDPAIATPRPCRTILTRRTWLQS
jgi:PAS domain S-box-containing protein